MKELINSEQLPHPRLIGAAFFAAYALFFMVLTKYTLLSLRDSKLLPLLPTLVFALAIGLLVGGIFGKALAKQGKWFRPVLIGIFLALASLALGSLEIFFYYYSLNIPFFSQPNPWQDYLVLYGVIFISLLLTIGVWLIPLSALAAIYFNKRFFPGLIALDKHWLHAKKGKTDVHR